ncbi:MAG: hypothetical protein ACRCXA_08210 [Peptostreptococcaceae bacterium]
MKINYNILNNLIKANKGMKLEFRGDSSILDVYIGYKLVLTLELRSNIIEENCEIIYNSITELSDITLYIPKIYIKEY